MLTETFKKKTMNDTQSTFLGAKPSIQQQMDIFSNLYGQDIKDNSIDKIKQENMDQDKTLGEQFDDIAMKAKDNKEREDKRKRIDIYRQKQIKEDFSSKKPTNFQEII